MVHEGIHQKLALGAKDEDSNHNLYNTEIKTLEAVISKYSTDNNLNFSPEAITALAFSGQQLSKRF
ncbi:hypothetical protein [Emticicia sp. 17c]|uniref:hypothetical protein n=1 Tax=Emticicia sp. 17c TaxID=3127704 RepID=UPI00301C96BB